MRQQIGLTKDGIEEAYRAAAKDAKEARDKFLALDRTTTPEDVVQKSRKSMDSTAAEEAKLKARLDDLAKVATERQHLLELDKRSREIYANSAGAGNGEFGRLYAQRGALEVAQSDDLRKAGKDPAMRGRVLADYALQFAANSNDLDGALKKWRESVNRILSDAPELDVQKTMKANAERMMQENGGDFFAHNPGLFSNSITPPRPDRRARSWLSVMLATTSGGHSDCSALKHRCMECRKGIKYPVPTRCAKNWPMTSTPRSSASRT